MKLSLIVPAFNEELLLPDSLRAIKRASESFLKIGWDTELIVCDNNSTDRTADVARGLGATVVFEPVNQIARARNCGAAAATGDWLVFVDADSQPTAELFAEVAETIATGTCMAGGVTVRVEGINSWIHRVTALWNRISRSMRWMAGSFIFCDATAFRRVGGFSLELFAAEELDLSKRLKKLAKKERKKIVILHKHPLLTSSRKVHLYTAQEHIRFLLRTVLGAGKTLNSREACHTWYDGRR